MSMDVNTLRLAVEILSFVAFLGIVAWALAPRNRAGFDQAASIPLDHE